jgi:hypothetical protein
MTGSEFPNADTMRRTVRTAVHGYLSVIAPLAYRLHRFDA